MVFYPETDRRFEEVFTALRPYIMELFKEMADSALPDNECNSDIFNTLFRRYGQGLKLAAKRKRPTNELPMHFFDLENLVEEDPYIRWRGFFVLEAVCNKCIVLIKSRKFQFPHEGRAIEWVKNLRQKMKGEFTVWLDGMIKKLWNILDTPTNLEHCTTRVLALPEKRGWNFEEMNARKVLVPEKYVPAAFQKYGSSFQAFFLVNWEIQTHCIEDGGGQKTIKKVFANLADTFDKKPPRKSEFLLEPHLLFFCYIEEAKFHQLVSWENFNLLEFFIAEAQLSQSIDRRKTVSLNTRKPGAVVKQNFIRSVPRLDNFRIKKSKIPKAGFGLFPRKNFKEGNVITIYEGHLVGTNERIVNGTTTGTHILQLLHKTKYNDGHRIPVAGCGCAQFVNEPPAGVDPNATFVKVNMDKHTIPYAVLVAKRDIKKGEEIYASYGNGYQRNY
jgi:SET domain